MVAIKPITPTMTTVDACLRVWLRHAGFEVLVLLTEEVPLLLVRSHLSPCCCCCCCWLTFQGRGWVGGALAGKV